MNLNILNPLEKRINEEVFRVYNLKKSDFNDKTIEEYHNYLEEREQIIYQKVNRIKPEEADSKLNKFKAKYKNIIDRRLIEAQEKERTKSFQIFPLLTQLTISDQKIFNFQLFDSQTLDYSPEKYKKELDKRKNDWKPNEDISYDIVSGAKFEWKKMKSDQELKSSILFLNKKFQNL